MTKKRSFLDEAIHQATLKERERIIKLLDGHCDNNHSWADQCYCSELIALIKGEQK